MSLVKLLKLWDNLRSGFWFLPSLLAFASLVLTVICPWIDQEFAGMGDWLAEKGYLADLEGCRTILSVTASSSITVAGVVFSITMVVLATMSGQFGPRLLPNFMRQESTKFVLGGFIGTFIYCMLSLSMLNKGGQNGDIPEITVLVGLLLGIFSFALLIYFIHRVARFIQAPCILHDVAMRLHGNLKAYFPESGPEEAGEKGQQAREGGGDDGVEGFSGPGTQLTFRKGGYLQVVDIASMVEWASANDATVELMKRPGDFIIADETVLLVRGKSKLSEEDESELRSAFVVGVNRTDNQDVEFAVDQLVEVAVRALSPGINDPYTAINCIDHLGGALVFLSGRKEPESICRDKKGQGRLKRRKYTSSGILDVAFHPLRQHGKAMPSVAIRLMEVMVMLGRRKLSEDFRRSLLHHARLLHEDIGEAWGQKADRDDFEERYRLTEELIG